MIRARVRLGFLLFVLAACSAARNPVGLSAVPQPFTAPAIYRQWYSELEVCSGLKGNYDAIGFFTMPDPYTASGEDAGGTWRREHTILIREDQTNTKWLVEHEMMHDLLHSDPHGLLLLISAHEEHPLHYFLEVCGDLLWTNQSP